MRLGVDERGWARAITGAGWACVVAYVALVAILVNRARLTDDAGFRDGVWGQRLEVLSFAAFPQQLAVLVPAAIAVVATSFLDRDAVDSVEPWRQRLVRVTAGTAIVAVVLAFADILAVVLADDQSVGEFGDVLQRVAGVALAWGVIRVCLEAERQSPQAPRSPVR